ncbi:MAG: DNA adenine methylase [Chloroflexota bacterium]
MSTSNPPLLSPLRYPGSKRRLANYIKQALEINHFKPTLYIEPFVGGASVVLQLLQRDMIEQVILMDLDPWIASFWQTIFFDTDWLIDQIQETDVTLENWFIVKQSNPLSTREQAWACFFLNRTSFSGILEKKAGPLGGKEQWSDYKIDCRFPKKTLVDRIQRISEHRDKIHGIRCTSWDEGIIRIRNEQEKGNIPKQGLFFYLDPPFFEKADALYRYYFRPEDHIKLRDVLLVLEDKWILSYDSANQVEALYGSAIRSHQNSTKKHNVELLYSVSIMQERKKGKEVILSNLEHLPSFDEATK